VPLAQIPTPLTGKDADTTDGKHLPSTVADLLTDHDKAAHDALKIDADTVDGYHAVDLLGYTIVSKAFTYTFSSPLLIITAFDGWVIVDAWIEITTAWTGLVPGLSVGDASDVDGYLIDANIDESKAGYYGFELDNRGAYLWDISEKHVRQKIYTTSTAINVYKIGSPGAGAATVYLGIIRLKQEK